ncbi:helix-turn-helix transcriptional regulator [Roseateles toxinivorans]|uniref:Putative DNA-binding transcriptional regulator YafY n=1 Tax=Roseateles toxinivorans TaxID=270368 RepID=A0A4V6PV62_9BURK|nr:YafY family protein [Roseateles toxinivorans]TDP72304.1 putative DNA-binding transcriptional regulator YafY [Roseateles toxinivorans]
MLSASSRLLQLLSLLQARRHWAGPELAERLGVHPRTLRRDIDRLRELGYPVAASSGVAGGYALRAGQAMPPLLLDDEEALAVAIALRTAASGQVGGIEEPALQAMVKLEQLMPARLRRRADALRSAVQAMDPVGPSVDAGLLADLAGACRDQLGLDFDYVDAKGEPSRRRVEPQGVVHTGHRWYLVAWDTLRSDWRTFRIDRIAGTAMVGRHFTPRIGPEGGDLRAFVARSVVLSPHAEQARVILHAPLAQMAARIPATAARLEAVDDEQRCLLQCGAHALDSLVYWLMALEVEFEVLAPPALRERLALAAERVMRGLGRLGDPPKPVLL